MMDKIKFQSLTKKNISTAENKTVVLDNPELTTKLYNVINDFEGYKKDQNVKLIEFLGIFAAILALIISSVNIVITPNLSVRNMILIFCLISLTLLIFVLGIDTLIKQNNKLQFYILFFTIMILIVLGYIFL